MSTESDDHAWTAYVRGFGQYIGEILYPTLEEARADSCPGERIYRIVHVETLTSESFTERKP